MEHKEDATISICFLPIDIFSIVLSLVNYASIYSGFARTCKLFRRIADDNAIVLSIIKREFKMEKVVIKTPSTPKNILMMKHRACTILQNVLLRKKLIPYSMAFYACRGIPRVCDFYRKFGGTCAGESKAEKLVFWSREKITDKRKYDECCTKEWYGEHCVWALLVQDCLSYLLFDRVIIEKASDDDGENMSVILAARLHLIHIQKWTVEQEARFDRLNRKAFIFRGQNLNTMSLKQANAVFPDKAARSRFFETEILSVTNEPYSLVEDPVTN